MSSFKLPTARTDFRTWPEGGTLTPPLQHPPTCQSDFFSSSSHWLVSHCIYSGAQKAKRHQYSGSPTQVLWRVPVLGERNRECVSSGCRAVGRGCTSAFPPSCSGLVLLPAADTTVPYFACSFHPPVPESPPDSQVQFLLPYLRRAWLAFILTSRAALPFSDCFSNASPQPNPNPTSFASLSGQYLHTCAFWH